MSPSSWKTIQTKVIFEARNPDEISFKQDEIELPDGKRFEYVYAHSPYEVVFVVGVDAGGRVAMLRQHRHLVQDELWEIPAGSPEREESLESGALREFEEESGFRAKKIEHLSSFYPSVGMTDQVNHVFVAWDLEESIQRLEETELIRVRYLPFDDAVELVYSGQVKNVGAAYGLLMAKHWWDRRA